MQHETAPLTLIAEIVEDERQLDGSRHIELVGEQAAESISIALRLVVDRDGVVAESELNFEHGEAFDVISFEPSGDALADERADERAGDLLELTLRSDRAELELLQVDDGDVQLTLRINNEAAG